MKITGIRAWRVELPLHEGSYNWSGGKSRRPSSTARSSRVETDAGLDRLRRGLPAGAVLPAGLRRGRPRRASRELGPHLLGDDPRELGRLNRRMDAALKGHPYVKSAHRHRLLGHPRPGDRPARLHAAGRPLRRRLRPLPRHLAGVARRDGRQGRRLPRRGLPPVPAQGRRRSRRRHRAHPRRAPRVLQPGDRLVADANTGWTHARGGLRVVRRGARRRRLHRAALPDLRGVPGRPPPHRPAVRARRDHRRPGRCCCAAMPTGRWTWST